MVKVKNEVKRSYLTQLRVATDFLMHKCGSKNVNFILFWIITL